MSENNDVQDEPASQQLSEEGEPIHHHHHHRHSRCPANAGSYRYADPVTQSGRHDPGYSPGEHPEDGGPAVSRTLKDGSREPAGVRDERRRREGSRRLRLWIWLRLR